MIFLRFLVGARTVFHLDVNVITDLHLVLWHYIS